MSESQGHVGISLSDKKFKSVYDTPQGVRVLDRGFVRLVDVMGGDYSVVQAARVSSGRGSKGLESDRKLINYLMKHRHTSPFEMVEFKFHIKAPVFVERQWFRHRTASINSASMRYKEMDDELYEPSTWLTQSGIDKQGSAAPLETIQALDASELLNEAYASARDAYTGLLGRGVSREDARITLPLGQYTEWYWKIDLHNLFHFLKLRLDPHAQHQIRDYAKEVARIVRNCVPMSWEAFEEYQLYAVTLSRTEARERLGQSSEDFLL